MAGRQPLLLGVGAVVGVLLAILVFGGPGGDNAAATLEPSAVASGSPVGSPGLESPGPTGAPPTDATSAPTAPTPTDEPPSAPPSAPGPTPTPTPNTDPAIVSFDVPKQEDCTGSTAGQVHLAWSVRNATGVSISIDGPGIYQSYPGLTGEVDVPFGCDHNQLEHTYMLTTVGGTGPAASLTKTIKARPPSIVSFRMGDAPCQPGDTSIGISMSFEVRAATGADLDRDGAPYSTYATKATDDIVQFDCTKPAQEFRLTTTGGYGPDASKKVTVHNPLFP